MVAEANYGGRVTDPKDRRLIKILLEDYYTPKILVDDYFFTPSDPNYYAPKEGPLEEYKNYIR